MSIADNSEIQRVKRVLIVNDDAICCTMLVHGLKELGYQTYRR